MMTPESDPSFIGSLAILAPTGRDAATIAQTLRSAGMPAMIVEDMPALCGLLQPGSDIGLAGVLIAEEVFSGGIAPLVDALGTQEPWSDLPIVVLTARGAKDGLGGRLAFLDVLGNVSLLDRPLHAETLQSAARSVLRARTRQFETRAYLHALRQDAVTLEARVQERTKKLMTVEETLRQSQKMDAIGQLTGGIAHDFNNLLGGILGSFELLQRRLDRGDTAGLKRYIDAGRISAERAAALTHRLLAFARRQTLDPKPTDVNALIRSMLDLMQRTLGPAISIETVLSDDLALTLCDPPQLESALLNLCINARDAMPDGGTLTIFTANAAIVHDPETPSGTAPGAYVCIGVADTGVGMSADVLARAFEPFFTTKPPGQGTGLGLAMLYGFAQQSGGYARIESVRDAGTTVRLLMPQYAGAAAAAAPLPDATSHTVSQTDKTVLIVDDEKHVRMVIADVLRDMACTVIEADGASPGLAVLESSRRIDLVISDIGMPGTMNGLEMIEAGRRLRPGLKALFVTGYAAPAVIAKHRGGDAMHVLRKPFGIEELTRRVDALLNAA